MFPILLSYGTNPNTGSAMAVKADVSQILSAMLPFVVALTAIAALTQPFTFTWVSKELYAPSLGGIMLSIGIKLSIEDFKLAFKRPLPLSIHEVRITVGAWGSTIASYRHYLEFLSSSLVDERGRRERTITLEKERGKQL